MMNSTRRGAFLGLLVVPALILTGISLPTGAAQAVVGKEIPQSELGYPEFTGDKDPMPAPGVDYDPSASYLAKIFARDQENGAGSDTEHDFWIDRMLARTGAMFDGTENAVAFTRGRAAFMKTHSPEKLGWMGDLAYWESLGRGGAYSITLNVGGHDLTLKENVKERKQTPSYFHSVFTADGLRVVQDKYFTNENVLVSSLTLMSTAETKEVAITVASDHAKTVSGNELVGSEIAMNNITTVKPRISGDGLMAKDGVLRATVSATNSGTSLKIQMGLIVDENPSSLTEYQEYSKLSASEAFTKHVTEYNRWWVDHLVYLDTPENNIDKTLFYRWWLMRYNFLDADVPGNDYQFPTSMEGVLGYNNAIVLTIGMFMDDLKYFRDPMYSYGPALSAGETSKSGKFVDNPGDPANWSNSYTQYITEAAWRAYQVHGGPAQIGTPLARHGEEDINGLIQAYDSNGNHLIEYNWGAMTGNDADAVSFSWRGGYMDRTESAYLYSNALAAANFYSISGDTTSAQRMTDFAKSVRQSVLDVLWEDKTNQPDEVGLYGNLLKHAYVSDGKLNPWKEINNYYPFTVGLMPKKGDADYDPKYVEALRLFADADQYPVFPFYTANQVDKAARTATGIEGSNNFSIINSTVWFRMLSSVLRDYPSKYLTPETYKQLLYWNAFAHYQNGDNRLPNQNEFWSNGSAKDGGSIGYRSWIHHTILGTTNFTMIEDAMGLRPREDSTIELDPIDIGWDHFTANNISYHGQDLSIVWDKDGSHYGGPAGYSVYLDGQLMFTVDRLAHVTYDPAHGTVSVVEGDAKIVSSQVGSLKNAGEVSYSDDSRVVDIFAKAGTDISQASGGSMNLAREATVSSSYTAKGTTVETVNDGTTVNEPFWGTAGTTNAMDTLDLDLGTVQSVDDVRVFFYRSSTTATVPGYAAPKQFLLQYWDGNEWKPVPRQARTPLYPQGNLNIVRFPEVETSRLRLVFEHAPGAATGVKEVQAFSTGIVPEETTNAAPKVVATQDGSYIAANRARVVAQIADDGQPNGKLTTSWSVTSAPKGAQVMFEDASSAATTVRYTMPGTYVFTVTVSDGELESTDTVTVENQSTDAARKNIAPDAVVETSSVTGWNRNDAINDGKAPWPIPNEAAAWGTWGTQPNAEGRYTATLTWTEPHRIDEARVFFHDNTREGNGGVRVPTDWVLEYQNSDGKWVPVPGASEYTSEIGVFNTVEFTPVSTKSLRVSMSRPTPGYPGIVEWEVYGDHPTSVEPVAVRTLVGKPPELPATVEAVYANGDRVELPVTWADIAPAQYAVEGSFKVVGFVEGSSLLAQATVSVRPNDAVQINTFAPINVVTQVGKAPSIPSKITVTYNDGSTTSLPVTWDAIDADAYAKEGTFEVHGTVEGTDKKPVAVVTVTADSSAVPVVTVTSDPVLTEGQWTNRSVAVTATASDVRDPKPVIEYRNAGGQWQTYSGSVTVNSPGHHTLEFRATAEGERQSRSAKITVSIDSEAPSAQISWDEQRRLATITASDGKNQSGIDHVEYRIGQSDARVRALDGEWEEATGPILIEDETTITARAIDKAGNVSEQVAHKVGKPSNDYRRNIAPEATVKASFTTGWNRESGVNDRHIEFPLADQTHAWGTWSNQDASHTINLTWEKPRLVDTTSIYFFDDGDQMRAPKSWTLEYLTKDGQWKPVENPSGFPVAADSFNTVSHAPVETTALRMTMDKPDVGYVGIVEWEVFEAAAQVEPTLRLPGGAVKAGSSTEISVTGAHPGSKWEVMIAGGSPVETIADTDGNVAASVTVPVGFVGNTLVITATSGETVLSGEITIMSNSDDDGDDDGSSQLGDGEEPQITPLNPGQPGSRGGAVASGQRKHSHGKKLHGTLSSTGTAASALLLGTGALLSAGLIVQITRRRH
ncbi:Ig-like domain-containing protein [Schaalia sp. ZJ1691]|uniref:Ig-like domain-containing protein n=1 Tax=Schaalia sp. ZJ1691 TaxID=2709404 RepID=UPI0013EDE8BD|nr:Ig-like domain-containing protein [Schaalia sp. ZJ1691]